jgi:hypothetical protein
MYDHQHAPPATLPSDLGRLPDGKVTLLQVRTDDWYDTGLHIAAFDATFGKAKPIFLQYKLPAVALPPPIQVVFVEPPCQPLDLSNMLYALDCCQSPDLSIS